LAGVRFEPHGLNLGLNSDEGGVGSLQKEEVYSYDFQSALLSENYSVSASPSSHLCTMFWRVSSNFVAANGFLEQQEH
jgi:hypothetical protein